MGTLLFSALLLWLSSADTGRAETLLVLGDSLSSAYGIDPQKSWVALLEKRLRETDPRPWKIVNASRSGETTFGGKRRLLKLLERHRPGIVILELGGNDGLRGFPPARIEENLAAMIEMAQSARAHVVLVEVELPRNYGERYRRRFKEIFRHLAERFGVELVSSWLMPEILRPGMLQPDGLHPTEGLQPYLFAKIWRVLNPLLEEICSGGAPSSSGERPSGD